MGLVLALSEPLATGIGLKSLRGPEEDVAIFQVNRGLSLLGGGELDAAEKCFKRALSADPASPHPYAGMAALARTRGWPETETHWLDLAA